MRLPKQSIQFRTLIPSCSLAILLACSSFALAEQETGKPGQLVFEPAQVNLVGTRAMQQLQVTAQLHQRRCSRFDW